MKAKDDTLGEMERGQQMLRDQIAESDRLIGETERRLIDSKALTDATSAPSGVAQASTQDH